MEATDSNITYGRSIHIRTKQVEIIEQTEMSYISIDLILRISRGQFGHHIKVSQSWCQPLTVATVQQRDLGDQRTRLTGAQPCHRTHLELKKLKVTAVVPPKKVKGKVFYGQDSGNTHRRNYYHWLLGQISTTSAKANKSSPLEEKPQQKSTQASYRQWRQR